MCNTKIVNIVAVSNIQKLGFILYLLNTCSIASTAFVTISLVIFHVAF